MILYVIDDHLIWEIKQHIYIHTCMYICLYIYIYVAIRGLKHASWESCAQHAKWSHAAQNNIHTWICTPEINSQQVQYIKRCMRSIHIDHFMYFALFYFVPGVHIYIYIYTHVCICCSVLHGSGSARRAYYYPHYTCLKPPLETCTNTHIPMLYVHIHIYIYIYITVIPGFLRAWMP